MPRYLTDCAAARGKDRGLKQLDLMDEAATILTVRHEAEEAKAELRSTGPPSSLRRDISLIIPSMISTQEVLQNLGQYSNKGHVYSDEDEEDLVLGQRHNSVQNSASAATIYDEVSPIIPPLTPLPSSLPLAIPSKERHVTSRQASSHKRQAAPPHTINSGDGDDDPIMDFEDSGDDNGIVDINSVEDPDPIVSSISPSLVSSPRHLIRQPLGLNAIRPLGPPTSPSRRFVIPSAAAITPGNRGQVPDSPSKRLRPISELPRPVAPPFLQMQRSPGRRGIPGSPSKRQSKGRKGSAHADVLIQPVTEASAARTTLSPAPKRTPTTRVSEIARALKNVQPPPLLAPQLLQLAEESRHRKDRDLYEDDEELEPRARKRGRQGLDKGLDQNRKAAHIEKDALPVASSGCMEHTINSSWAPPSYTGSPELSMKEEPKLSPVSPHSALEVKKQVVSEESPEKRIAQSPFLVSPPSPTLEGMRRIKKEESSTPLLGMLKKMSGSQSCLPTSHPESAQVSKHPQEQSSRELLQHPPPLSRQDQSQECHQMKSYRKVPQQQRSLQPTKPHAEEFIPLPTIVLEHVSKLTPIDHIKWPPAKAGRFHLFALVMSIGPEEQIVTKTGQASAKRQLSICDQSATSFKLDLWRDRCKWADMIKIGDVVMITDVQTKEYRQKVTGSTSAWSKMSRLDGSLLASYQGHVTTESCLKILIEKRRVLALDLLDKDKGIARDPSFYLSLGSVPAQLGATFGATGAALVEQGKGCVQGRAQRGSKAGGSELLSLLSTASMVAPHMNISSNVSAPTPPQFLTGSSIRASVVFRMLRVPGDESQGWEIGAVMSSGRLVKIQSQNTLPWIKDASPGKLLHFFGKFKQGSDIYAESREPYCLSEGWGNSAKQSDPRHFASIRLLHEHDFMGDAVLDAYILSARFLDFAIDGPEDQDMFGFIQCYCTVCHTAAVSSPQNPGIFFCPICHLDPQNNHRSCEWMYPALELSLGDKPRVGANLSAEMLQLRCQHEIGDQVFLSVPARRWMQSQGEFWKSRARWKRLLGIMNSTGVQRDDEGQEMESGMDMWNRIPQKVRVRVRVGVNMMAKALKVDYL